MNGNIITNRTTRDGKRELASCVGEQAVMAFRYRTLLIMLRFRAKTGMDITGKVSSIKVAKHDTGLRTNNIDLLIIGVEALLAETLDGCTITTKEAEDAAL